MPIWPREKTAVAEAISLAPASWRIPFWSVEPLACALDCLIIVGSSILSGLAYHRWLLGGAGEFSTSLAVCLLVAVNFTTILVSRGSYKPLNLIALQGRIKETTAIWLVVCSLLLAVVFSLKVGANLSRGATATFTFVGLTLLISWRAVLSSYLAKALARGSFAERRMVLIGEPDELDASDCLIRLRRCGYRPIESYPVIETDFDADNGMSPRLRSVLDQVIRTAQSGTVEEIVL